MLSHVKKIVKFSTKVASSTKNKVEYEVGRFVKKHKVPVKEGKALAKKIVNELKVNTIKVGNFVAAEFRKELKNVQPFVTSGKKAVKKSGLKAKNAASRIAKRAFGKAKGKTKKIAKKVIARIRKKV